MEFVPLGNLRDYLRTMSSYSPLSQTTHHMPPLSHPSPQSAPPPHHPAHTRLMMTCSNSTSSSTCSSGYPLLPTSTHAPLSAQPSEVSTHSYIYFSSDNAAATTTTTPCQSPVSTAVPSTSSHSPDCSPARNWAWSQQTSNQNTTNSCANFTDINFEKCALQIAEGLSHLQEMNVRSFFSWSFLLYSTFCIIIIMCVGYSLWPCCEKRVDIARFHP